jgi:hypothetical protein
MLVLPTVSRIFIMLSSRPDVSDGFTDELSTSLLGAADIDSVTSLGDSNGFDMAKCAIGLVTSVSSKLSCQRVGCLAYLMSFSRRLEYRFASKRFDRVEP